MRTVVTVIGFLVACAAYANADMKVKDYKASLASPDGAMAAKLFIQGLGEGIGWANAAIARTGQKALYCQPATTALDRDKFVALLDQQIKALTPGGPEAQLDEFDVALLLLQGLKEAFPCAKK
jgi:hypothetical protein